MTTSFYVKTSSGTQKLDVGGGGFGTRTVVKDASRSATISAGTEYTVPSHAVGINAVAIYLDGLRYDDFSEISATSISFDIDIPTTMEITVVVDA